MSLFPFLFEEVVRPAGCTHSQVVAFLSDKGKFSILRVKLFMTFLVSLRSQSTVLGMSYWTKRAEPPDSFVYEIIVKLLYRALEYWKWVDAVTG